jgi:hypothetical protein
MHTQGEDDMTVEARQPDADDLNALLAAMPPGTIDMGQIEANDLHNGHRFFGPPDVVREWLLDRQRRVQTADRALEDALVHIEHTSSQGADV